VLELVTDLLENSNKMEMSHLTTEPNKLKGKEMIATETPYAVLNSWDPESSTRSSSWMDRHFAPTAPRPLPCFRRRLAFRGVNLHTWTGWGSVTHWNGLVANLAMHGQGTFYDPRLDNAEQFPIAAREGFGHLRVEYRRSL